MSIEEAYNVWADQYDTNHNRTRDLDKEATKEVLGKYEFSRVIEVGCGTGKNTAFFLEKANVLTGLDFSEAMLSKARARFSGKSVEFVKTDITRPWPIQDEVADLVSFNLVLEHISDLDFVFSQGYQKLEQNGLMFVSELHPFRQYNGSKAKFNGSEGTTELQTFVHHVSEFTASARDNFELIELNEWFDSENPRSNPRLITFVFRKK